MLVQMRTYQFLLGTVDEHRYWGANIPRPMDPNMSKRARERLIHEKYILKTWVSKKTGWEVEMQKKFPLNMDELAVLEHLTTSHHPPRAPPILPSVPEKRPTSRPDKRSKDPNAREKRPISRDSRWSDEIICDGRSVRLAVIEDSQFPRLHRSEKIINDSRRRKSHHRTKHHENPLKKDEERRAGSTPSTKEEIVR